MTDEEFMDQPIDVETVIRIQGKVPSLFYLSALSDKQLNEKSPKMKKLQFGGPGENRTPTSLRTLDFESSVSTSYRQKY
jgi:hypothetical protein